jgi:hypothetical protein
MSAVGGVLLGNALRAKRAHPAFIVTGNPSFAYRLGEKRENILYASGE